MAEHDPFHAYIARPISGKTPEESRRLTEQANVVAEILADCGCTTYDPGQDPAATAGSFFPDPTGYRYNREKLALADFAIFLLAGASWGVGAQNEIAASLAIPVLFLRPHEERHLSPMMSSSFSLHWQLNYAGTAELREVLPSVLKAVEKPITWSREVRRITQTRRDPAAFGANLAARRQDTGLTHEMLAKLSATSVIMIQALEELPDTVISPSLELIYRLAAVLQITPAQLVGWDTE